METNQHQNLNESISQVVDEGISRERRRANELIGRYQKAGKYGGDVGTSVQKDLAREAGHKYTKAKASADRAKPRREKYIKGRVAAGDFKAARRAERHDRESAGTRKALDYTSAGPESHAASRFTRGGGSPGKTDRHGRVIQSDERNPASVRRQAVKKAKRVKIRQEKAKAKALAGPSPSNPRTRVFFRAK